MNLKPIGISALLILIIFLLYNTVGVGIATLIFAIIFLVQAILFSIKPDYYDKFLSFMNPGLYSAYSEKGSDFIKKKRRMNIIGYYVLSAITGFNAFLQIRLMTRIDTRPLFNMRELLLFALVILGLIFLTNYISILTMKKAKTANEDLAWNIILGIAFAIILLGFISFYILRPII
ncbi:hypothetical protein [Desulfitobacterium metallireducens]|uniref:Uncharacterized protein n=1 Tax=Desulfitobacterium metallireducens DSM 15288 TaxID=871968 RepID=W0EAZ1_9FIRM|nr:hypothetical protein [Desulfitobacterium metallireducens]AHF06211.1 hypothetical protein DESME_03430 [Desulfitobacterium metallireducens DSM 15288]